MQNQTLPEHQTLSSLVNAGVKLTPMMEQYYQVKKQYPDIILMFRMGDFYEMFFEDAREAARLLNISLTVRGKLGDVPIPMAVFLIMQPRPMLTVFPNWERRWLFVNR